MKKLFIVAFSILSLIVLPKPVEAASGKISINSSTSNVIVGNTITVTVTLSGASPLGAWEFDINYDNRFLKLTYSNAENNGTYFVNAGNGSIKSKTYTLKFKALKSGTTSITVGSNDVYAFDESSMTITKSNKKLTIMTREELEATYSKDNNLKSLTVEGYELDKEFNKNTLEYTVNVPTGTTSVKIKAIENDSKASVSGDGEVTVTEGLNTIPIVVTAQNGSEKTYTLIINVEDQNPINVKVDNNDYIVVKNAALLTAPTTFVESKVNINNFEIPSFRNNAADLTLVGLKDNTGTISLFIYNNGEYSKYNEMNLKSYLLVPTNVEKELDLIKTTVSINGEIIDAYKYMEDSEFVIISAKSLEDGKTNLYLYDTVNKTASRYDEDFVKNTNETLKNYTYVIMTFAGLLLLMLILIFSLIHSLRKKQKKINKFIAKQEAKIEATRKLNDVVEEVKKITENEKKETLEEPKTDEISKKLTKKELKRLKKEESQKEIAKDEEIKPKEDDVKQDEEEVYDLFSDDKKKKKKKKH